MVARHKKYSHETAAGLWYQGEKALDEVRRAHCTPVLQYRPGDVKPAALSPHRSVDALGDAVALLAVPYQPLRAGEPA